MSPKLFHETAKMEWVKYVCATHILFFMIAITSFSYNFNSSYKEAF